MSELLGRIQALWNGLAPRERLLVGLAGSAVAIMILFFGIVMPVMAATPTMPIPVSLMSKVRAGIKQTS